jgi:O-antigen/teichoic acid export membrane protein
MKVARPGRFIREASASGLALGIARLAAFMTVPIYSRALGAEDFGTLNLFVSGLAVTAVLYTLGLDAALNRWYWFSSNQEDRDRSLASALWFQIALASVIGLVLLVVGILLPGGAATGADLALAGLCLPGAAITAGTTAALRIRREPWKAAAFASAVALASAGGGLFAVAATGSDVTGVLLAQALSGAVAAAGAAWMLGSRAAPRLFSIARVRAMLGFGIHAVPASASLWLIMLSDRFFIAGWHGLEEVARYQVACAVAGSIGVLASGVGQAWGPYALSQRERPDAGQTYMRVLRGYAAVSCMLAPVVALCAPLLLALAAPGALRPHPALVGVLVLGQTLAGLTPFAALAPTLADRPSLLTRAAVLGASVNVGLSLALIPAWGIAGAAAATLIGQGTVPVSLFFLGRGLVAWRPSKVAPVFVAGAAAVLMVSLAGPGGAGVAWTFAGAVIVAATAWPASFHRPVRMAALAWRTTLVR